MVDTAAQARDSFRSGGHARLPERTERWTSRSFDYPGRQLRRCRSSDTGNQSDQQEGSTTQCRAHDGNIFLPRRSADSLGSRCGC